MTLTVQEVAKILKVTDQTVCKLIKERKLACYQIGRRYRINEEDLEAFKQSAKQNIEQKET